MLRLMHILETGKEFCLVLFYCPPKCGMIKQVIIDHTSPMASRGSYLLLTKAESHAVSYCPHSFKFVQGPNIVLEKKPKDPLVTVQSDKTS